MSLEEENMPYAVRKKRLELRRFVGDRQAIVLEAKALTGVFKFGQLTGRADACDASFTVWLTYRQVVVKAVWVPS